MKLQIDTIAKTIKIEERININTLVEALQKLLPDEWKDYELDSNISIVTWTNPQTITEPVRSITYNVELI